jgi:hypothetical protein
MSRPAALAASPDSPSVVSEAPAALPPQSPAPPPPDSPPPPAAGLPRSLHCATAESESTGPLLAALMVSRARSSSSRSAAISRSSSGCSSAAALPPQPRPPAPPRSGSGPAAAAEWTRRSLAACSSERRHSRSQLARGPSRHALICCTCRPRRRGVYVRAAPGPGCARGAPVRVRSCPSPLLDSRSAGPLAGAAVGLASVRRVGPRTPLEQAKACHGA